MYAWVIATQEDWRRACAWSDASRAARALAAWCEATGAQAAARAAAAAALRAVWLRPALRAWAWAAVGGRARRRRAWQGWRQAVQRRRAERLAEQMADVYNSFRSQRAVRFLADSA